MDVVSTQRRMARSSSRTNETEKPKPSKPGPFRRLVMRRRSNSAPPSTGRRRLLEEHFRVDPIKRVVLPGVPKHEADWPRDAHDFFNLVVLIPLVALNIMNWDWDMLLDMPSNKSYEDAWTGEWFYVFYFYCQSYFLSDLLWIILIPNCVRSPMTIIQHHVATILYMLIPWFYPQFRLFMGCLLCVELNTWFLIARRVFNKQGFPPWIIDLPPFLSIRIKMISLCFYLTWITIRCMLYPFLWFEFIHRYNLSAEESGSRLSIWVIVLPLHSCFLMLNLKWSYDLLMSKLRYWRRRSGDAKKDYPAKGL